MAGDLGQSGGWKRGIKPHRDDLERAEVALGLSETSAAIYREALQQIVDSDPQALDAQRIAAKALGDATEYENTGRVQWRPPQAMLRGRRLEVERDRYREALRNAHAAILEGKLKLAIAHIPPEVLR